MTGAVVVQRLKEDFVLLLGLGRGAEGFRRGVGVVRGLGKVAGVGVSDVR